MRPGVIGLGQDPSTRELRPSFELVSRTQAYPPFSIPAAQDATAPLRRATCGRVAPRAVPRVLGTGLPRY